MKVVRRFEFVGIILSRAPFCVFLHVLFCFSPPFFFASIPVAYLPRSQSRYTTIESGKGYASQVSSYHVGGGGKRGLEGTENW